MKRDVMRLGEDHLFSRYTNLKSRQKQEEEMMEKMLMGGDIGATKSTGQKASGLKKVSFFMLNQVYQLGSMIDKKKIVVEVRSSEEQQTVKKANNVSSSMMQLVGSSAQQQNQPSKKAGPFIFGLRKP